MSRYGKALLTGILLSGMLAICSGCGSSPSPWASEESWFQDGRETDDNLVDVFYIVSTNVINSFDENGNKVYNAVLNADERLAFDAEYRYADRMFGDSLNFFAPYYHQFTMESVRLPEESFSRIFKDVTDEMCGAFDYYMKNLNGGRHFFLAGFSQGAMLIPELLRHMSDEQYALMDGAYMLGYRLTEDDLKHPHINEASGETGIGETVSFNSVMTADAIWPFVSDGAATCINPLNWCTDSTPAELDYHGDKAEVSVDTLRNVLVVSGLDPEKYHFAAGDGYYEPGNLHHWDLLFYSKDIRRNAMLKAYRNKTAAAFQTNTQ